jgi:hypothetical protein
VASLVTWGIVERRERRKAHDLPGNRSTDD